MKKHILLIEDNDIIRENTAELLRFADYDVSTASDGMEGVKQVQKLNPDLILCDVVMPKLDGFGVYQVLSKDNTSNRIPFIFLTARTSNKDRRKGMEMGADDYIFKPFNESNLLSAISTRLAKAAARNVRNDSREFVSKQVMSFPKVDSLKELIAILCKKKTYTYKKGDNLYCEQNNSNHIYLIKEGAVKTFKNTQEGKELITGLFKKNQFVGYTSSLGGFSHADSAEVLEDSKLIKIQNTEVAAIFESNPHIAMDIIAMLANNIRVMKDTMLQMAYGTVRYRTAKTLILLSKESMVDNILISRYDLACYTGIAKETLIRTLTDFKEEGLIETSRKYIKIINLEKLKSIK